MPCWAQAVLLPHTKPHPCPSSSSSLLIIIIFDLESSEDTAWNPFPCKTSLKHDISLLLHYIKCCPPLVAWLFEF